MMASTQVHQQVAKPVRTRKSQPNKVEKSLTVKIAVKNQTRKNDVGFFKRERS